jgi:hypothetical protein
MNHPERVGGCEGARDANPDLHRLGQGEAPSPQPRRQVFALEPLHGQERRPVLGAAVGDVLDDGRMIEPEEQLRLSLEPGVLRRAVGAVHLDRDVAAGGPIARAKDLPHPPLPHSLEDGEARGERLSHVDHHRAFQWPLARIGGRVGVDRRREEGR